MTSVDKEVYTFVLALFYVQVHRFSGMSTEPVLSIEEKVSYFKVTTPPAGFEPAKSWS